MADAVEDHQRTCASEDVTGRLTSVQMALEIYLDEAADKAVRRAWAILDAAGIRSLGSVADTDYHPHVSLAVFDDVEPELVAKSCSDLAVAALGCPIVLSAVGFFLTDEAPAFLAVSPSHRLLALHAAVISAVRPHVSGFWPHYETDVLFPHCTLAMAVPDRAAVVSALDGLELPISAEASGVHLVDVLTGASLTNLSRS